MGSDWHSRESKRSLKSMRQSRGNRSAALAAIADQCREFYTQIGERKLQSQDAVRSSSRERPLWVPKPTFVAVQPIRKQVPS
jgi:hypothetical protein